MWITYKRCRLNKEIILQMTVKVINNTLRLNDLVATLLVFRAYFCISEFDTLLSTIT